MPTPAYTPLDSTHLVPGTDADDVPVFTQADLNALADESALLGMLGWDHTYTFAAGVLTLLVCAKGVYRVKVAFTYVAGGPADGAVDTETHSWSNDSGATYALRTDTGAAAGVRTYSYDGSGDVSASVWS